MYIKREFLAIKGASSKSSKVTEVSPKPRAEKLLLGLPYYNRYPTEDLSRYYQSL
jgi:hypothetical protein